MVKAMEKTTKSIEKRKRDKHPIAAYKSIHVKNTKTIRNRVVVMNISTM